MEGRADIPEGAPHIDDAILCLGFSRKCRSELSLCFESFWPHIRRWARHSPIFIHLQSARVFIFGSVFVLHNIFRKEIFGNVCFYLVCAIGFVSVGVGVFLGVWLYSTHSSITLLKCSFKTHWSSLERILPIHMCWRLLKHRYSIPFMIIIRKK